MDSPSPQKIAVTAHPALPGARELTEEIVHFLEKECVEAKLYDSIFNEELRQHAGNGKLDMLVAAGGDGTMIRAGHLCAPLNLPIIGINLGSFGFLPEVEPDNWQEMLLKALKGEYRLEKRMMLRVELRSGEESSQDEVLDTWHVLNEVIVCRGWYVRPIHIEAFVDGYHLATYIADGLIASTPTGSTAYALAVGGPIMPPELRNILIIPVAAHLTVDRAVILSQGARVVIKAHADDNVVLSIDGQPPVRMNVSDYVYVQADEHSVSFVRFQDEGYFYRNITRYMERNPATLKHL